MKWAWPIGQMNGIKIYLHGTFLILLAWILIAGLAQGHGLAGSVANVCFVVALFGIVVLHEMGHALMARRFGIRTRDITLLPIGGVARMERIPERPIQELLVALAGPAVNLVLAGILFLVLLPAGGLGAIAHPAPMDAWDLARYLMLVNLGLAAFNLIPAFPMDGGRMLRALLALRMPYVEATHIAAHFGQGFALLFGLVGLFYGNPFLVFIALFVWIGAAAEAGMVQIRAAIGGIPIEQAMMRDFKQLRPEDPLEDAIEHALEGFQHDFPVTLDGAVVGVLTRDDLIQALAHYQPTTPVGSVMSRTFQIAHPGEMLETVFARLEDRSWSIMIVQRDDELVGLVTPDNLGEFLMVREALHKHRRPGKRLDLDDRLTDESLLILR